MELSGPVICYGEEEIVSPLPIHSLFLAHCIPSYHPLHLRPMQPPTRHFFPFSHLASRANQRLSLRLPASTYNPLPQLTAPSGQGTQLVTRWFLAAPHTKEAPSLPCWESFHLPGYCTSDRDGSRFRSRSAEDIIRPPNTHNTRSS